jgi:integrase
MAKPITIREGSVRVQVYCVPSRGKKRWEVRDHFGGRGNTHRRKFTSKKAALIYAQERAIQMANAASARYRLTEVQCYDYERALEILKPTGKTILQLAHDELERWQIAQQIKITESPLVSDLVEQFLADKRRQELSHYHLRDLDVRLSRFKSDFQLPINRIGRAELEAWLNGLGVKSRTWNNYRAAIAALCKFAKERKYLPSDWAEIDAIAAVKLKRRRIAIFTPDNMSTLLSAASERILPAIVIGAFAGLRSEEVQRLHWSDIKWDKGYIFLREDITKTNRTRTVPILDNLAEWLQPWSEASGKVCTYANLSVGKTNLARRVGLKWSKNILRDSFISYRLAQTQDLAKVALEAGNSPSVIHRHYLELAVPAEAEKWFAIRPRTIEQNVLPLKFA